jgi:amidase
MQRGVYGRPEGPYNADYLTAAWYSGSSSGSGTATPANFAAFGMGEETVSSGRSPASNNGLIAYTPSRGIIYLRGNWPLFPTRDVVVPHTRTLEDMFHVLNVIEADDPDHTDDFWRTQTVVQLPSAASIRPINYLNLKDLNALKGKRIGVPKMYIGKDGKRARPIAVRSSILALWQQAAQARVHPSLCQRCQAHHRGRCAPMVGKPAFVR